MTTIVSHLSNAEIDAKTPVEIDTLLAEWHHQHNLTQARIAQHLDAVDYWRKRPYGDEAQNLGRADAEAEKASLLRETLEDIAAEIEVLNGSWNRRGGWTRAFLVTNRGGHVHSSQHCSTCFGTTEYFWVTEFSGHEEDEIVEAAGERACTVCYPSAPVEVLSRPTRIFSDAEKDQQKAREERAAKKAEREAAQVTLEVFSSSARRNPDGSWNRSVRTQVVTWKTLRALQNDAGALVRNLAGSWAIINGFDLDVAAHPREAQDNLEVILAALKARGVDTDTLVTRNRKRAEKEG